jgi:hypothetical protein
MGGPDSGQSILGFGRVSCVCNYVCMRAEISREAHLWTSVMIVALLSLVQHQAA